VIDRFMGRYDFLSNFHPCRIEFEGQTYRSVEHAYQAAKTEDPHIRKRFEVCPSPGLAKRLGRVVQLRDGWEQLKLGIMEQLLRQKFQDGALRSALLATGTQMLMEGNWWGDIFWGVYEGQGKNHLGLLLMKVREELRESRGGSTSERHGAGNGAG
jgi:ribA/ribD-fused uncharacterized protein